MYYKSLNFSFTYFFADLLVDSSILRQIYQDKFFQIYLWLHSKGLSNGLNNNVTAPAGTNQKLKNNFSSDREIDDKAK